MRIIVRIHKFSRQYYRVTYMILYERVLHGVIVVTDIYPVLCIYVVHNFKGFLKHISKLIDGCGWLM